MPHYQAAPQRPGEVSTPFKQPNRLDIIVRAEAIILGARDSDPDHVDLRDTCREFLGYEVPRAKPKPPGDVHYCTSCHEWKHRRDFTLDSRKLEGIDSRCKECERQRQKRLRMRRNQTYRKTA